MPVISNYECTLFHSHTHAHTVEPMIAFINRTIRSKIIYTCIYCWQFMISSLGGCLVSLWTANVGGNGSFVWKYHAPTHLSSKLTGWFIFYMHDNRRNVQHMHKCHKIHKFLFYKIFIVYLSGRQRASIWGCGSVNIPGYT